MRESLWKFLRRRGGLRDLVQQTTNEGLSPDVLDRALEAGGWRGRERNLPTTVTEIFNDPGTSWEITDGTLTIRRLEVDESAVEVDEPQGEFRVERRGAASSTWVGLLGKSGFAEALSLYERMRETYPYIEWRVSEVPDE